MLYLFLSVLVLIPVVMGIGKLYEKLFSPLWKGISGIVIAGSVTLSVVWMVLAFFFSINQWIEIASVCIGILSFFYFKLYFLLISFLKENYKIFLPGMAFILLGGSYYPYILDHFGYYVPTIKWISEVGLVKGIANLDLVLGQMSVWHIFQAGFSHFIDSYFRLNAIFLIVYFIYACEKKSWLHVFIIPILILFSQSPSPDLPSIIFSMMVLDEVMKKNSNVSGLFLLSAFVFVIKPTLVWLPILMLLYGFVLQRKRTVLWLASGSAIVFIFVIKNIWCFGFPLFPLQVFDLNLPWKPNASILETSSKIAIEKTFDMQFRANEIQQFSAFEYWKNWFSLKGIKAKINILFILTLIAFFCFSIVKKERLIWCIFFSILIKSVAVLLFSAQYRFFLDVFFVVFFVIAYHRSSRNFAFLGFYLQSLIIIAALSFPKWIKTHVPSFKLGQYITGFQVDQLYRPSYFELNEFDRYQIGNFKFNVAKGYPFSFDVSIPAITSEFLNECLKAGIFPQTYRAHNLKSGFYWKNLTSAEKMKLSKVVEQSKLDFEKQISNP